MILDIVVFLDSTYKNNTSFTMNVTGDIVSHNGKGRDEITKEVEKRYPNWYSYDIHRIENKEVTEKD